MPSEADIVWSLKQHLQSQGLGRDRWPVSDIAVDSDGSYRGSRYATELEPMISMPIKGFYPDLVCSYRQSTEEGLAAFEVKGGFDGWIKGISQARAYREGVHLSYLALPDAKGGRLSALERDAAESGIGIWLFRKEGWSEIMPPSPPRPSLMEARNLLAALRGVVLPRRLQLNHPVNYLAAVWAKSLHPTAKPLAAIALEWSGLRTTGSRQHAINGAGYLGLLNNNGELTRLGLTVADLLTSLRLDSSNINRRCRFCEEAPGLAAVTRLILFQQESTKLIVDTFDKNGNSRMNTEQLLRAACILNQPLASGLFLTDPRDLGKTKIPSSAFSASFIFQFKQALWHAGILKMPMHSTAGKGAEMYRHEEDYWMIEERFAQSWLH